MKKIAIFAAVIIAFTTSCRQIHGSGNLVTEKRQEGSFKGISVGSAFEVELKNGPSSVEIEADDNVIKFVQTSVRGGILHIEFKNGFSLSDVHLKAYISAPEITSIKTSGAAHVNAMDPLKSDRKIELETSGAGNIDATVDAPEVETGVSGAGDIEVKGRTRSHRAHASGGGSIKASELLAENVNAETSGAGSVHVHASVSLKAHASGAGNVFYRGGGSVESDVSGAGSVKKED